MSEKIDVGELVERGHSWLTVAVCNLLGEQYGEIMKGGGRTLEIELRLNGIEVSFRSFIKHLESEYSDMVMRGARELIEERCGEALDAVASVVDHAKRLASDTLGVGND